MSDEVALRKAGREDIAVLVDHRRRMYEDWGAAEGKDFKPADLAAMAKDYADYLRVHLADGVAHAWLAKLGGQVVGSGAVSILAFPPGPAVRAGHVALLHSMYTVPEYRRRGVARRIVETAIAFCRARGCTRLDIGGAGTRAGQPLYESVGFRPREQWQLAL